MIEFTETYKNGEVVRVGDIVIYDQDIDTTPERLIFKKRIVTGVNQNLLQYYYQYTNGFYCIQCRNITPIINEFCAPKYYILLSRA